MTCKTLLLAHARMAQPLAWSGGSLCVAYARASMPRVSRGPRRPPRHAWHRLVRPNLAAPAAASLPAIIVGPSVAAGAAGEAAGGRGNKNTIAFKRSRTRTGCNKPTAVIASSWLPVPADATRDEVVSPRTAALSACVAWRRVHMRHRGCHLTMPVAEPCVYELVEVSCTSYCIS